MAMAAACVALAAYLVVAGLRLLPSPSAAAARDVTAQLVISWLLIAAAVLPALTLAAFLLFRAGARSA
jgi:hypothetical protein